MNEHLKSGRTEQKLNTRSKILTAAHRLLEQGKSLSMDNVATEAQLSRATVYRYYSSIESLSTELVLHLNLPNPEVLAQQFDDHEPTKALLGIQDTFLDFIINNEIASKKFLGAILSSSDVKLERGQNRLNAIKHYFLSQDIPLNKEKREKLMHVTVLLMGIEAIIVSKDVCGLDNKQSKETLQWALQMVLKGCLE
ncbi:MAG: TetR/AcrR family transcriptional regulator [Allomuricauda sp.]|nr:MAG: TetR/AcrR family transcriptional regulator [Allomuricauda sp.]